MRGQVWSQAQRAAAAIPALIAYMNVLAVKVRSRISGACGLSASGRTICACLLLGSLMAVHAVVFGQRPFTLGKNRVQCRLLLLFE